MASSYLIYEREFTLDIVDCLRLETCVHDNARGNLVEPSSSLLEIKYLDEV